MELRVRGGEREKKRDHWGRWRARLLRAAAWRDMLWTARRMAAGGCCCEGGRVRVGRVVRRVRNENDIVMEGSAGLLDHYCSGETMVDVRKKGCMEICRLDVKTRVDVGEKISE